MEIIRIGLKDCIELEPLAACIGYFDGLHLGHMQLIKETLNCAHDKKIKSACITFEPDPWCILKEMTDVEHITSMEDRINIARQFDLDYWIILEFTKDLASLEPKLFEEFLSKMNIQTLICGFDYSYGYKGKGNVETLKKQQFFDVICVDEVLYDHQKVSSTRIEKCIQSGDIKEAMILLGRPYALKGKVINGRSQGSSIGFPTANIRLSYSYVIPKNGVYIGYAVVNHHHYRCMLNIGHNPTFNYQKNLSIEANLLDFDEDIYNKEIEIVFIERIRDEIKFESKEKLIDQLKIDVKKAAALHKPF